MRSLLAALAAFLLLGPAGATEPAARAPSIHDKFRFDSTYENGRIMRLKTPRGVTRYEYGKEGRLARKILPGGVTVDYYHDRDGKLVETRFSTGLVRTSHYDRDGMLAKIVGSDGYILNASGPKGLRTVVVTGPKEYRVDLTPVIEKGKTSYASMMGKLRPKALMISSGGVGAGGGCEITWWGDMACDASDGGDYGGGSGYDDGWGGGGDGGDEWGGDQGAGDYGDDAGYGGDEDAGGDWGGEQGDAGAGSGSGYEHGGGSGGGGWGESPGDRVYLRCMETNCEQQNRDFREFCAKEINGNKEMCYRYTAKYYFQCERQCWYQSY